MHRRDVEIFEDFTAWEAAARIEAFKAAGGRHLVPLMHAVAQFDCRVAVIWQRSLRFRFHGPRPTIGIWETTRIAHSVRAGFTGSR